jgi:hypothetical protein
MRPVSASVAYKRAGGFVGGHWGTLSNCYSTGTATGPAEVGGFCGYGTASTTAATGILKLQVLRAVQLAQANDSPDETAATFTGWDL